MLPPSLILCLLAPSHALTPPPTSPVGFEIPSSPGGAHDTSASRPIPLGIPEGFTVHTQESTGGGPPLRDTAVYLTAVKSLEEICLHHREESHIQEIWSIPPLDVQILLITNEQPPLRFAAWGIQAAVTSAWSGGYRPEKTTLEWHGVAVGYIELSHAGKPADGMVELFVKDDVALKVDDRHTHSANSGLSAKAVHDFEVVPTLRGRAIPMFDVLITIIDVMVKGSEEGPNTFCNGISIAKFSLRPIRDSRTGQGILRWGALVQLMAGLARWTIAGARFEEMDIVIKRDGSPIAKGRLGRR